METKSTLYNEFPLFLKRYFSYKVQKISLNAGFTCPNRDGNKGVGGCTYCNNQTFNPDYCRTEKSITRQLEEGKQFFAHKYPEMKYLAYFQAYTNTYGELEDLKRKYEEALSADGVVGLVIGTRPDCMPDSESSKTKQSFMSMPMASAPFLYGSGSGFECVTISPVTMAANSSRNPGFCSYRLSIFF